jgi:pimeloyl-ACP methyl ester carboxylesterase/class 3 adenylate cyclase
MTSETAMPETRYAESDGLSIAYQVFGSGAQDLVVVPGIVSNVEIQWEDPQYAEWAGKMGQSFRMIMFDKRGQGMSDAFEGVSTLEERMDDVRAVMAAAGSQRAVLVGFSEGGSMAALFASTYPAMVERLILYATFARFTGAEDYPHRPALEPLMQAYLQMWGKPEALHRFTPSRVNDAAYLAIGLRLMRQSASPAQIRKLVLANDQIDVRAILPQIRRPTLVLHRRGDQSISKENGRYLAEHIPEATYLEMPGEDHVGWVGDIDAFIDAIVHFAKAPVHAKAVMADRYLSTVLFTDIVGSTERAAQLGDRAWRDLLQQFHAIGRGQLQALRGREIDTAGDGLFATFDGPARAIRCAAAIGREAKKIGIDLRAGLHTGEVETTGEKVSGLAVHIGARVMSHAGAGEVLVSNTVKDLVAGSGITFEERGSHALKGVPGEWRLFRALAN